MIVAYAVSHKGKVTFSSRDPVWARTLNSCKVTDLYHEEAYKLLEGKLKLAHETIIELRKVDPDCSEGEADRIKQIIDLHKENNELKRQLIELQTRRKITRLPKPTEKISS